MMKGEQNRISLYVYNLKNRTKFWHLVRKITGVIILPHEKQNKKAAYSAALSIFSITSLNL